jgi:hypothetical protein
MKRTHSSRKSITAEAIARQADKGRDVSRHFANEGKMKPPAQGQGLRRALEALCDARNDRHAQELKRTIADSICE